eukprot:GHVT01069282.1.p1 GENE.GHVT01069282.1~~GHVT01069282.1.p1  ORF type:complete len:302 (-),score=13.29 GHVT01069282.1:334-1239(-)
MVYSVWPCCGRAIFGFLDVFDFHRYFCWHTFSLCWIFRLIVNQMGTSAEPGWVREFFVNPAGGRWYVLATESEFKQGSFGWPMLLMGSEDKLCYLVQLGFWISCLVFVFWENQRKDFWVLCLHHVTTTTLLVFSYTCVYWRPGLVVLFLHDIADVFLYLAKCWNYSKAPAAASEILFAVFLVSYLVSRIIIFPITCVVPAFHSFEAFEIAISGLSSGGALPPGALFMPCFMAVLYAMHIYWFYLILKVAVRIHQGKNNGEELKDIRSDDEDSGGETETTSVDERRKSKPTRPIARNDKKQK